MSSFFQYNLIHTTLSAETRTLQVTLNREDLENRISLELIFELESLLHWVTPKVEISTIVFQSSTPYFSIGLASETIKNQDFQYITSLKKRIWDLQKLMLSLPQTCVCDFQLGASNIGIETFLGCDLFVCSKNAEFKLDNLQKGLPLFSPKAILNSTLGKNLNNFLHKNTIKPEDLKQSVFLFDTYLKNHKEFIRKTLDNINKHSSFTRIQTKMYMAEDLIEDASIDHEHEMQLVSGLNITNDWRGQGFQKIKDVKEKIRLTLIQGGKEA